MAAELDVSASYITLIEANQRPASAKLLMQLAAVYDLNVSELAPSGDAQLVSDFAASLKDPVMEAQISRTGIEQAMQSAPDKLNIGFSHNLFSDPRAIYSGRLNMDQTQPREYPLQLLAARKTLSRLARRPDQLPPVRE